MFAHSMNVCPFICDLVYKHTLTLCICLTEAKSVFQKVSNTLLYTGRVQF